MFVALATAAFVFAGVALVVIAGWDYVKNRLPVRAFTELIGGAVLLTLGAGGSIFVAAVH